MKVLIVDDEPVVAALLAESLGLQGHEAIVAHDGQTAIQLIESTALDAVLLDLDLPDLNGVEVLTRTRPTHPTLPVIVLAGRPVAHLVPSAERLGVAAVVEKPIALTRVMDALGRVTCGARPDATS